MNTKEVTSLKRGDKIYYNKMGKEMTVHFVCPDLETIYVEEGGWVKKDDLKDFFIKSKNNRLDIVE